MLHFEVSDDQLKLNNLLPPVKIGLTSLLTIDVNGSFERVEI